MASIEIVSGLVLMASAGSASMAQQHQGFIHDRCHAEVQEFCAPLPAGALTGCLRAHGGQLSLTCQSALADPHARHSAQSAN